MRHLSILISLFAVLGLTACSKTDDKPAETKPPYDILSTQHEELQKAKDVEKQLQQQAEEQRKVIEVQTR